MSYVIIGGTNVGVGQMSYVVIGGTNVGVGQMSVEQTSVALVSVGQKSRHHKKGFIFIRILTLLLEFYTFKAQM